MEAFIIEDIEPEYNLRWKALKKLSKDDLNNVIKDYYDDVKIKDIISKYDLDVQPNRLFASFPPVILKDIRCEYDDSYALAELNSKSSSVMSGQIIDYKSAYCPDCMHKIYDENCDCWNCRHKEEKENNKKLNAILKSSALAKLDLNFLSDFKSYDKLLISAYIRGFLNENMDYIDELSSRENRILPKYDYKNDPDIEFVTFLLNSNYIYFSKESDLSSFIFKKKDDNYIIDRYYPSLVKFNINMVNDVDDISEDGNLETENVINLLMHPDRSEFINDKDLCYKIWKKIALMECKEYMLSELKKVHFDSFKPGKKTDNVIGHLLNNFSTSQIFGLIHNRVNNAIRYYQEGNVPKKRAANAIITNLETIGEKALANNWDVTSYRRDYNMVESQLSKLFFNYILGISDQGFYSVPTKDI